jgi:hypothetical protein
MINLTELAKSMAFLPLIVLTIIVLRYYWKKSKNREENKKLIEKHKDDVFTIPNVNNDYKEKDKTFSNGNTIKKLKPTNYNDIQRLSKYNKGTYRDLKGRYASLINADYE